MFRTSLIAAVALTAATAAQAQPYDDYERGRGRGGAAILYELPNFRGASVRVEGYAPNLSNHGFNDRARSARLEGSWRLCEHGDFGGRCEEARGSIPDLNMLGLSGRLSSLQPSTGYGDGPGYGGPGYGGGRDQRGIDGENAVFFPRPTVRGVDVAAGSNGANSFCRRQGLGAALYFDSSARAPRAIGPEGQFVGSSTVLRDLLCRKY